jgi:hypothetical protein
MPTLSNHHVSDDRNGNNSYNRYCGQLSVSASRSRIVSFNFTISFGAHAQNYKSLFYLKLSSMNCEKTLAKQLQNHILALLAVFAKGQVGLVKTQKLLC